jgi:hypothetical protein
MPKPISVILHDNKIIASFACRDEAVKEFKKIEIVEGEISLHLLDRPDRKKKATKLSQAEVTSPKASPKKGAL